MTIATTQTHKILRWFSNFLFNCSSSSRSSWSHPVLPATNRNEGETNLVDPSPEAGMTPQLTMSRFVLRAIALHYSIIYDLQSFSVTNHLGHDSDGLSNCAGIRYIVVVLYVLLKQLKRISLHVCVIVLFLTHCGFNLSWFKKSGILHSGSSPWKLETASISIP